MQLKRADSMKRGESVVLLSTVGHSMSTVNEDMKTRMRCKFDVCCVIAKHSACHLLSFLHSLNWRSGMGWTLKSLLIHQISINHSLAS